mmetsp:Transcript_13227/g.21909  ORF Transcript_13227/g.21909 Transcript_13227/m.21909 type:complete len:444 (-) Transcript_13227:76-1407(-)
MHSKWFDCCANISAYHYQSSRYSDLAPPSFGNHADLLNQNVTRNRERIEQKEMTQEEYSKALIKRMESQADAPRSGFMQYMRSKRAKKSNSERLVRKKKKKKMTSGRQEKMKRRTEPRKWIRAASVGGGRLSVSERYRQSIGDNRGGLDTSNDKFDELIESPLLMEAVHLFSLLSAVALATLRNDVPEIESPLVRYEPGDPFPPVDPDQLDKDIRREYGDDSKLWTSMYFILGISRSDKHRTLYNHARPFKVLGGISDGEIEELRRARGPSAKVALCFMWVQEFISREQLNGGFGQIPSPIVSRCYQFASDGMKGYNDSRKVAYIPFPFCHQQLTIIFLTVATWMFPILFYSYVNSMGLACVLNFTTVLCFMGLHEVAREIENPFLHVPNNLPLTTFQAQFNEALVTTWAGFHPDSWFEIPEVNLPELLKSSNGIPEETKRPE